MRVDFDTIVTGHNDGEEPFHIVSDGERARCHANTERRYFSGLISDFFRFFASDTIGIWWTVLRFCWSL